MGLLNVFCGGGGGGGDSGATSATTGTTNTATFSGTQGGANPASQDLTARNTSTTEQAWSATASSKDAGRAVPAWLTIATSSGTAAAGGTITLTISVDLTGLAAGTYTATITLSPAGVFDPPSFTITLTVSAPTGGGPPPPGPQPTGPYHNWGANCIECHSWNIVQLHNRDSAGYRADCIKCHGDKTQETTLSTTVQAIHPLMCPYVYAAAGQTTINDAVCAHCHESVDFLTGSAGAIRKQVAPADCVLCHTAAGPGKQLYQ